MKKLKAVLLAIIIIAPTALNHNASKKNQHIQRVSSKSKEINQIKLNPAIKKTKSKDDYKNILDQQSQNKKINTSNKKILSEIHKNTTIYLKSSNIFTYSISYKTWLKKSDGSNALINKKTVIQAKNKMISISVAFFTLSDLAIHVGLAGQKNTKITLKNSSILSNLVKSEFKDNENPQFVVNVSGQITKPNFDVDYVNNSTKASQMSASKETKIGSFNVESSSSWWNQNGWWTGMVIAAFMAAISIISITFSFGVFGKLKAFLRARVEDFFNDDNAQGNNANANNAEIETGTEMQDSTGRKAEIEKSDTDTNGYTIETLRGNTRDFVKVNPLVSSDTPEPSIAPRPVIDSKGSTDELSGVVKSKPNSASNTSVETANDDNSNTKKVNEVTDKTQNEKIEQGSDVSLSGASLGETNSVKPEIQTSSNWKDVLSEEVISKPKIQNKPIPPEVHLYLDRPDYGGEGNYNAWDESFKFMPKPKYIDDPVDDADKSQLPKEIVVTTIKTEEIFFEYQKGGFDNQPFERGRFSVMREREVQTRYRAGAEGIGQDKEAFLGTWRKAMINPNIKIVDENEEDAYDMYTLAIFQPNVEFAPTISPLVYDNPVLKDSYYVPADHTPAFWENFDFSTESNDTQYTLKRRYVFDNDMLGFESDLNLDGYRRERLISDKDELGYDSLVHVEIMFKKEPWKLHPPARFSRGNIELYPSALDGLENSTLRRRK